jgi:DNA (cytosine-5)-methyltransferase 1
VNKFIPAIEEEYDKAGYHLIYQLYNSKYWGVPQNRERYFLLGIRKDLNKSFIFPQQQTEFIPKLSSVLEESVDEKYYIDDLKAAKIIEQAIEGLKVKQATKKGYDIAVEGDSINISHPNSKTRRGSVGKQVAQTLLTGTEQVVVEGLKEVHPCITPDRVDKRQNGRRAKGNEEEMFTLTSQDLHGVIQKEPKIEILGLLDMKGHDLIRRVYDPEGLSPTLNTCQGGNLQPKILEEIQSVFTDKDGTAYCCDANYAKGISPGDVGNGRRTQVIEKISKETGLLHENGVGKTLRVGGKGSLSAKHNYEHLVTPLFRVRKLSPREYARLQGFPDSYEQVVSNSQFYKQMGNAVTTNVAHAIAKAIGEQL